MKTNRATCQPTQKNFFFAFIIYLHFSRSSLGVCLVFILFAFVFFSLEFRRHRRKKIYYIRHYCWMSSVVECVSAMHRSDRPWTEFCCVSTADKDMRERLWVYALLVEVTHDKTNESMVQSEPTTTPSQPPPAIDMFVDAHLKSVLEGFFPFWWISPTVGPFSPGKLKLVINGCSQLANSFSLTEIIFASSA